MTDEQIIDSLGWDFGSGRDCDQMHEQLHEALAAARAEEHARCVRLLRELVTGTENEMKLYALEYAADWLERHKP